MHFVTRKELIQRLAEIISTQKLEHPLRVGIDGVDAAGKTFLADELAKKIHNRKVIRASIDGFHNPKETRYQKGRLSPEGYYSDSFNCQKLIDVLLKPLGSVNDLQYQTSIFNHHTDSFVDTPKMKANHNDVLIFDGIFLFRPELKDYWDVKIFVDVPFSVTIPRAIKRDGDEAKVQYEKRYVPGQKLYLQEAQPMEQADIIIDNSDFENPSIKTLRGRNS